jgi:hypothetical protein
MEPQFDPSDLAQEKHPSLLGTQSVLERALEALDRSHRLLEATSSLLEPWRKAPEGRAQARDAAE